MMANFQNTNYTLKKNGKEGFLIYVIEKKNFFYPSVKKIKKG